MVSRAGPINNLIRSTDRLARLPSLDQTHHRTRPGLIQTRDYLLVLNNLVPSSTATNDAIDNFFNTPYPGLKKIQGRLGTPPLVETCSVGNTRHHHSFPSLPLDTITISMGVHMHVRIAVGVRVTYVRT